MPSADTALDFVMGFVANSKKYKQQFEECQEEVMNNFMVRLDYETTARERSPYRNQPVYRSTRRQVMLKDNETNKVITAYKAKMMRALFGDTHKEYVRAQPVGFEDAKKSRVQTALLRYVFSREGHYRTFEETLIDLGVFGTAIVESPWKYEERDVLARSLSMDPMTGERIDKMERIPKYPVYDDVCLRNVDPMDFYPDPGRYRLHEMGGCAKRFRMYAGEARRNGTFTKSKVEEAIGKGTGAVSSATNSDNFRRGLDQPADTEAPSEFKEMIGYEYWGDVPDGIQLRDSDGKVVDTDRGVITVLNGVVVRQDAWPLADYCLPFTAFVINPMNGRFFGLAPAEIIRYDQSFADAVKILLAEAIVRKVHPPIAFDPDADVDIAKLKIWKSDALIAARGGPNSIGTVKYDADINAGWSLLNGLKESMQEGANARGAVQGESGPDRESASVGSQRLQFAMDPIESVAMLLENEPLPALSKSILRRYQQFTEDDADLQRRVGEVPGATLEDIMGDSDVFFSGSRQTMNRQQKLQGVDRLVSLAQVFPAVQMVLPTVEIAQAIVGDLMEMPEIALLIGQDPQMMQANIQAMQMGQGGPAQNGVPPAPEAPGMLPAQAGGGPV